MDELYIGYFRDFQWHQWKCRFCILSPVQIYIEIHLFGALQWQKWVLAFAFWAPHCSNWIFAKTFTARKTCFWCTSV